MIVCSSALCFQVFYVHKCFHALVELLLFRRILMSTSWCNGRTLLWWERPWGKWRCSCGGCCCVAASLSKLRRDFLVEPPSTSTIKIANRDLYVVSAAFATIYYPFVDIATIIGKKCWPDSSPSFRFHV